MFEDLLQSRAESLHVSLRPQKIFLINFHLLRSGFPVNITTTNLILVLLLIRSQPKGSALRFNVEILQVYSQQPLRFRIYKKFLIYYNYLPNSLHSAFILSMC